MIRFRCPTSTAPARDAPATAKASAQARGEASRAGEVVNASVMVASTSPLFNRLGGEPNTGAALLRALIRCGESGPIARAGCRGAGSSSRGGSSVRKSADGEGGAQMRRSGRDGPGNRWHGPQGLHGAVNQQIDKPQPGKEHRPGPRDSIHQYLERARRQARHIRARCSGEAACPTFPRSDLAGAA